MDSDLNPASSEIIFANNNFHAVVCRKCGAKMYPEALLEPHLARHQLKQQWFTRELDKLRHTMTHMREYA